MRSFIVILTLITSTAYGQYSWSTYLASPPKNPVIKFTESGNNIVVEVVGTSAKVWILKSSLMKTTVVRDTIKVTPVCPTCPPLIDVKTSQEYKDALQMLAPGDQDEWGVTG